MVWCVNVCPSVFAVQCASHFVFFPQILFRWVYAGIPVLPLREREREREMLAVVQVDV